MRFTLVALLFILLVSSVRSEPRIVTAYTPQSSTIRPIEPAQVRKILFPQEKKFPKMAPRKLKSHPANTRDSVPRQPPTDYPDIIVFALTVICFAGFITTVALRQKHLISAS